MGGVRPNESAAEQLLHAATVGLGHLGGAGQAPGQLARLLLQPVPQASLLAKQLAAGCHLDALADPGVRLLLGHQCFLDLSLVGPVVVSSCLRRRPAWSPSAAPSASC